MATPQIEERMTADEFLEAYPRREDRPAWTKPGSDLELWDGVVVEGEVPTYRHQGTLIRILLALDPWARARSGHTWFDADAKFGPRDVRRPDIMAWWSGQPFDPDHAFTAVPDLVVEVVSAQIRDVRRDREEKLRDYCAHGIPHYWIVDPIHRTFEALHLERRHGVRRYERVLLATTGSVGQFPGMGNFTLDLDACWRGAEG